ncbi:MAG: hypothetical protein ACOX6T_10480 [Myxococcales bacterium]|jgi:hypothetical protein
MRILATLLVLFSSTAALAANLPALRAEVADAAARAKAIGEERARMERSLGDAADRIQALKLEGEGKSGIFRNPELDELLKQSQVLSSQLNTLLATGRDVEAWLAQAESRLAVELDAEIGRLHQQWELSKSRDERRALISRLRALRAEREALRRAPATTVLPPLPEGASDDPEELLERADAFLDAEDKLRREQQALQERIEQLRHERELERRMSDFLGESALFDEGDRRIAVTRPAKAPGATVNPRADEDEPNGIPAPEQTPIVGGTDGTQGHFGTPGGPNEGGHGVDISSPGHQGGFEPLPDLGPRSGISRAPPESQGVSAYFEDETIEELEARQEELRERADELRRKADAAVRQARDLL